METLFESLDEMQWHIFCINLNDSRFPNQLEGRSVKGRVKSVGLVEVAKRRTNMFEVNVTPEKSCERTRKAWRVEEFRREMLVRRLTRLGRHLGWDGVWAG